MMNEWWLILVFVGLFSVALGLVLLPLRANKYFSLLIMPILLMVFVTAAYWRWGAWSDWQAYLQQQSKQQQIQALLDSVSGPKELIEKLEKRLDDRPESARGWYLLGRLYSTQNDWQKAYEAFAKAHRLQPDDEQITVNYAQSLWQLNQQQFNASVRNLFKDVLQKNPKQPDSLAMLAMDAYMSHDYQMAIDYWQRLLKIAPQGSDDADAIRKAIAKAQENMPSKSENQRRN